MPFTFADYRSSFIVHLKRMWVEKYESLCAAVGIPVDDTWDVAEANPGADVWPSVALLSIRVPPWASAIAKKFMEQNPSIPTGSAVRALADLISKAATWLHSQKNTANRFTPTSALYVDIRCNYVDIGCNYVDIGEIRMHMST